MLVPTLEDGSRGQLTLATRHVHGLNDFGMPKFLAAVSGATSDQSKQFKPRWQCEFLRPSAIDTKSFGMPKLFNMGSRSHRPATRIRVTSRHRERSDFGMPKSSRIRATLIRLTIAR